MIREVRPLRAADHADWLRLRHALWPDSEIHELEAELTAMWARRDYEPVFVAERYDGTLGGMIEVSLHEHAPGCTTSPVGYIEGWYVDPDLRRQGIGGRLVAAAEAWARDVGCRAMASDTEPGYPISPLAHIHLGYRETDTPWHYCKTLAGGGDSA